jgi:DNA polymerase-3 subunit epsilon
VPSHIDFLAPGLRSTGADAGEQPAALRETLAAASALLVIDLEMSGPNPAQHEVLEVGGVRATLAEGFPEESSWGERVRPRHIGNAVPGALKVVGYSPKAWRDAIDLAVAARRLADFGQGAVLTGWGIANDLRFLSETMRRAGLDWPFAPVAVDIQPIARRILRRGDDVDHFNLGHVADRLGIGRMGEHSALADAYATYDVLVALVARAAASQAGEAASGTG